MGLMEIELAKLDYRERVAEAARANTARANRERRRRAGRTIGRSVEQRVGRSVEQRAGRSVEQRVGRSVEQRVENSRSGGLANQVARHGDRRTAGVGQGAGPEPEQDASQAVHSHREAKIDSPVLSIRLGRFRYRLWFTRYVAV